MEVQSELRQSDTCQSDLWSLLLGDTMIWINAGFLVGYFWFEPKESNSTWVYCYGWSPKKTEPKFWLAFVARAKTETEWCRFNEAKHTEHACRCCCFIFVLYFFHVKLDDFENIVLHRPWLPSRPCALVLFYASVFLSSLKRNKECFV